MPVATVFDTQAGPVVTIHNLVTSKLFLPTLPRNGPIHVQLDRVSQAHQQPSVPKWHQHHLTASLPGYNDFSTHPAALVNKRLCYGILQTLKYQHTALESIVSWVTPWEVHHMPTMVSRNDW